MLNLLLSLVVAAALGAGTMYLPGANYWFAGIAAAVAGVGTFLLIMRHILKSIQNLAEIAQNDVQANRMEKAIATLKSGYKYNSWQFFTRSQVDAQIGSLYFIRRDFREAFPYLQKAFVRHWTAMGMLGVCYMKRHQKDKMIETFDKAVSATKKEPLLWNLYAFCLEKVGENSKAIEVMEKALKKCGHDDRLAENLQALQEGRRMKMKGYGDMWLQFHLEKMGAMIKKQTKAMTGRRKMQVR